jgi:aminoglycoside phosphotransferase (APT) family kinase protein
MEADEPELVALSQRFATLQKSINGTVVEGLPDLVSRLGHEIAESGMRPDLIAELVALLGQLDDRKRGVCHFDFHPLNVLVSATDWVVIDWLTVASGPPMADLARTMVLWGQREEPQAVLFMQQVRASGLALRGEVEATCDAWIRVVAGARLAEGFDESYSAWLRDVAEGDIRLFV